MEHISCMNHKLDIVSVQFFLQLSIYVHTSYKPNLPYFSLSFKKYNSFTALNFYCHTKYYCLLWVFSNSTFSARFICWFNFNFFWDKWNLFTTFWAFAIMILNYFIRWFQFWAFVKNKTTFFTNYLLRQYLTAVLDRNTNVTNYLYITKQRKPNPITGIKKDIFLIFNWFSFYGFPSQVIC